MYSCLRVRWEIYLVLYINGGRHKYGMAACVACLEVQKGSRRAVLEIDQVLFTEVDMLGDILAGGEPYYKGVPWWWGIVIFMLGKD